MTSSGSSPAKDKAASEHDQRRTRLGSDLWLEIVHGQRGRRRTMADENGAGSWTTPRTRPIADGGWWPARPRTRPAADRGQNTADRSRPRKWLLVSRRRQERGQQRSVDAGLHDQRGRRRTIADKIGGRSWPTLRMWPTADRGPYRPE